MLAAAQFSVLLGATVGCFRCIDFAVVLELKSYLLNSFLKQEEWRIA